MIDNNYCGTLILITILKRIYKHMHNLYTKQNMNLLRYIIIIISIILTSCTTKLKSPDVSYVIDEKNSLIFGKADVIYMGRKTDYSGKYLLFKKGIIHHISQFTSIEELNRSAFVAGDYSFWVTYEDNGYFVFTLPPGKYYFVEFDYLYVISASIETFRTYVDFPFLTKNIDNKNPLVITFEILPNSVTYIGTIKHIVKRYSRRQKNYHFRIEIVDEYEDAIKWFVNSNDKTESDMIKNIATVTYINSVNQ